MEPHILVALCLIVLEVTLVLAPFNRLIGVSAADVVFFALFVLIMDGFAVIGARYEVSVSVFILFSAVWLALPMRNRLIDILLALFIGIIVSLVTLYYHAYSFAFASGITGIIAGAAAEDKYAPIQLVSASVVAAEGISVLIDYLSTGAAQLTVGVYPGMPAVTAGVCIAYGVYALKLHARTVQKRVRESD